MNTLIILIMIMSALFLSIEYMLHYFSQQGKAMRKEGSSFITKKSK